MKTYLLRLTKILQITAPISSLVGCLVAPKYAATVAAFSISAWFCLFAVFGGLISLYFGVSGFVGLDRIYTRYSALAERVIYKRGQIGFRSRLYAVIIGIVVVIVSFIYEPATPVLFWLGLPVCAVNFSCFGILGFCVLLMKLAIPKYDGYVSYAYSVFNPVTGEISEHRDTCHIDDVDDKLMLNSLSNMINRRKYEIIHEDHHVS